MKLLLDENLSVRLVARLQNRYPGTQHVSQLGMQSMADLVIWEAARSSGFVLVSKDDDFRNLALVRGAPPKVVVLRIGNVSTDAAGSHLEAEFPTLFAFDADPKEAPLIV